MTIAQSEQWRRSTGSYYTPLDAASFLAEFVLQDYASTVLEPSVGGGIFVDAMRRKVANSGQQLSVYAVELDEGIYDAGVEAGHIRADFSANADFFEIKAFPVDAALGNPPFVRLRSLTAPARERALEASTRTLGRQMEPSGSTWMPFVLHAIEFVRLGGRVAFVLPAEALHVRYAKPFWTHISENFGITKVVQVDERLFPEILQDVVLLLASGKGGHSKSLVYERFVDRESLSKNAPTTSTHISFKDVVGDERPFMRAIVQTRRSTVPRDERIALLSDLVELRIGYVAGDKKFFHPDAVTVRHFGLSETSLQPALSSARQLRNVGLLTSEIQHPSSLFMPPGDLTASEHAYVQHGQRLGIDQRYKCRVRAPWHRVPVGRVADLIMPVFADQPRMVLNDAELVASNSYLTARVADRGVLSAEGIIAGWYTSFARLELEINVHSLGGGVLVLIPGEVGRIQIPISTCTDHLKELGDLLSKGDMESAYALGDRAVLRDQLGFSEGEIRDLRDSVKSLVSLRRKSRVND